MQFKCAPIWFQKVHFIIWSGWSLNKPVTLFPLEDRCWFPEDRLWSLRTGDCPSADWIWSPETGYGPLWTGSGPLMTGFGLVRTSYGPLRTGYGTLRTGYGPLRTGYGPLRTGYCPLRAGYGP